jgi:transposase
MDLDEVVYRTASGLDVHFCFVSACLVRTGPSGRPKVEERQFPTHQQGLRSLREWLKANGCEAVGMEATGVYWMPVFAALEGLCRIVVGNPQHMKNARGQKTDRKDARWIAGQMRHDRIRASFVPPLEFREARELARYRRQRIHARTGLRNEVQRLLARVGITLGGVVSDVFGVSGEAILNALAAGKSVIDELPSYLHTRLKKKVGSIAAALEAPLPEVSRYLLAMQLEQLEALEVQIQSIEAKLFEHLSAHKDKLDLLQQIPGISKLSAHIILAEIGVEMQAWPTEVHFSAWAGVAPGCKATGGKSKRAPVRKGNPYLCSMLMECVQGAVVRKDCHLKGKYHKLSAQLGSKMKARMAIAHKLALIIYAVLSKNSPYFEPTPKPPSPRNRKKLLQSSIRNLEKIGFKVTLEPILNAS